MVPMELRQMRMNLPAVHMLLPLGPMRIGACFCAVTDSGTDSGYGAARDRAARERGAARDSFGVAPRGTRGLGPGRETCTYNSQP